MGFSSTNETIVSPGMHSGPQGTCVYPNSYDSRQVSSRYLLPWLDALGIKTERSHLSDLLCLHDDETVTIAIETLLFPQLQTCQKIKIRTSLNPKGMSKI